VIFLDVERLLSTTERLRLEAPREDRAPVVAPAMSMMHGTPRVEPAHG
jgi:hypothetical protein